MLFAPRGFWGLFSESTGIQLFPVRRMLVGGPPIAASEGTPHALKGAPLVDPVGENAKPSRPGR
jgi:hypothetical protein